MATHVKMFISAMIWYAVVIMSIRAKFLKRYKQNGDINIGGLFPLHFYDESKQQCGNLRELGALKKVEAMVYTLERVNSNDSLLPNITLGYDIYDSCSYDSVALQAGLSMVPLLQTSDGLFCNYTDNDPVVGMVGAQRSSSSKQAALLLGHYQIPLVSFLSTSDELSNIDRYPYFLRTVAPDRFQVRVMLDLIKHFRWRYVSFLNSDDSFGKSAQREFRQQAAASDICLGIVRTISLYADDNTYDSVLDDLLYKQTSQTTVVLLFAQLETVYGILAAATRAEAGRSFIWIGGDGWGNYNNVDDIREYIAATVGAFTVAPLSKTLPDYDAYFSKEVPRQSDNPWLQEFWQAYGNCSTNNITERGWCNPPSQSVHESLVMDSTLAFVYALNAMHKDKCTNSFSNGICEEFRIALRSPEMLQYLLDTTFTSPVNGRIQFDSVGDGGGKYALFNLQQRGSDEYDFVRVGTWDGGAKADKALLLHAKIPWYLADRNRFDSLTGYPKSVCSERCSLGEKTSFFPENPCCWTCTSCQIQDRIVNNGTTCESCVNNDNDTYAWPSTDFTQCIPIDPVVNLKENPWAGLMILLAGLGVIFTYVLIGLYYINREKRLIKASSRELSCLIFLGILLSYILALLYILPPNPVICVLLRIGPPIASSLVYVSVAVKTVRLYRIFMAGKKSVKRPKFISPSFQVTITLGLCVIPVIWITVCLFLVPPKVVLDMPSLKEPRVEHTCSEGLLEKIGVMIWDITVVLVCCVYAFRTRKLPNNYKESRFITFCVFSTLLVQLAFSPTIFTTREPFYRSVYSALGLIVIATVANLCLFVIKFYALYFVAEKDLNVTISERQRTIDRNGFSSQNTITSEDSVPRQKHDLAPVIDNNKEETKPTPKSTTVGLVTTLTLLDPHNTLPKTGNDLTPVIDNYKEETKPTPKSTTGGLVTTLTLLDPHNTSPKTENDIEIKASKEPDATDKITSSGDVNLGFQDDEEEKPVPKGKYELEDGIGGVYVGPAETTT